MRTILIAIPVALRAQTGATAPSPTGLPARIDAIVTPFVNARDFSGNILVARNGRVLARRSYGQASYELAKRLAEAALPPDADEHRRELVALVGAAQALAGRR